MGGSSQESSTRRLIGNFYVDGATGDDVDIRQLFTHQTMVSDGQGNAMPGFSQTFTEAGDHVIGPDDDGKYQITGTDIVLVKMKVPWRK